MYHIKTRYGGIVMAIEFFPTIVVDPVTGKTFRQSRAADLSGMKRYRRARKLFPGIWFTYRNTFHDYPGGYRPHGKRRHTYVV